MAENAWPFYGAETNETQFAKWASSLADSGIVSGLAITPGTGMQVVLALGTGLVRGVFYENTAALNLTVTAAPAAGQTRRDRVILKLDQSANTITASVKAGTANTSGGTLPSLTQNDTTWEIELATLTVAGGASTITTAMIAEKRPSSGMRVIPYTTANRPTPASGRPALGLDITTKRLEMWSGSAWSNLFDLANIAGTMPAERGGTGQNITTQAGRLAALNALGIYVGNTTAPDASVDNRLWFKSA